MMRRGSVDYRGRWGLFLAKAARCMRARSAAAVKPEGGASRLAVSCERKAAREAMVGYWKRAVTGIWRRRVRTRREWASTSLREVPPMSKKLAFRSGVGRERIWDQRAERERSRSVRGGVGEV